MAEEHKKAFGCEMNDMGYPDMGNGRYSAQLEYEPWVRFNNAQRAHYNMGLMFDVDQVIESAPGVIGSLLTSGLAAPKLAAGLGFGYAVGRLLYARGYTSSKGADGRVVGAISSALCSLSLYGVAMVYGVRAAFF
ncbi:hypothetical protein T492DRAFT_511822 [Pavlovales sp. CCMP2436]|nr:hypothetical protein T492DRAFT_511822 [Pavlovales sp. CCMP2436]